MCDVEVSRCQAVCTFSAGKEFWLSVQQQLVRLEVCGIFDLHLEFVSPTITNVLLLIRDGEVALAIEVLENAIGQLLRQFVNANIL